MSSYHVVITETAQRDLLGIFDYISFELKEPDSARHLLSKIKAMVLSLEGMPERHTIQNFKTISKYFVKLTLH